VLENVGEGSFGKVYKVLLVSIILLLDFLPLHLSTFRLFRLEGKTRGFQLQ
jgi:hypothetical protein